MSEQVAQSLIDSLITAIKEQLKYVWSYGTYIKDLRDGLTCLEDARETRQEEVDRASYNAEEIYVEVTNWLKDVDKIIEEAKTVSEKDKNLNKGCCRGVIPNLSARFLIAKDAEEKKQEIEKLKQRNNFQSVSHPKLAAGIVTGNYKGPEYWIAPSRASLLVDISKALLDEKIRIVGVWGASGVGKSTFLKQLEKQVQKRELNYNFNAVTMATVTRTPKWETVQDDLGYRLGLKMEKENSVDQKSNRLWDRLSQKGKILIILDDIWEKIDLKNLGIPFDDDHPEIKLLLTSRSEQLLKSKMNSERNFQLNRLEECEAVDLFKNIVAIDDQPQDEALLINQLAKECQGLPVLISPLATSLKSLPSQKWREALSKLRESNKSGIENFINESLKFNHQLMESEEAKSLFLLCGQVGSQICYVYDLLVYAMGLGLLQGVHTIEEAREKLKLLLNNLKASCLLEEYGNDAVKLHDLMGDSALSITSKTHTSLVIRKGKMLKACSENYLRRCKSISMPNQDAIQELPNELKCPELDMLIIYTEGAHLEIPDAFFKNTRKLKVLDLSDMIFNSLPSSIQLLNELHTLCLDRVTIQDVKIIGTLKALQILTFRGSNISRIPKEIGELNNLRLFDITHCFALEVIEPNVLGSLIHMEELYLPHRFDKWDAEGSHNASLTELNNMLHLSTLHICVPNVASLLNIMPLQQLVRYKIYLGNLWFLADFDEERTLKLEFDSSNSKLIFKERIQTVLKKTQDLYLHGWIGIEDIVAKLSKEGFPELKHIRIESCPFVQYIVHSNQRDPFPVLESLALFGLINLQKICKGDLPHKFFNTLKVIKIEACHKLRNLFSLSLVRDLPTLEEVEVSDCTMVQELITYAEGERINHEGRVAEKVEKIELKGLHKLKLENLENISSFCYKESREIVEDDNNPLFEFLDGRQVSLPCLESMTLCELPMLRKISHSRYPVYLHDLRSLELLKLKSLSYALDSNLLQQLKNLESLVIKKCELMETVFHMEGLNTCEATTNQPVQINLTLSNLPRLRKIWDKDPHGAPSIPNLKKLEVSECDELENLFSTSMAKSLENISHISITSCMTMKEIFLKEENDDQEIEFSSLSYLSISKMENLAVFSRGNHHHQFPCLTQLIISHCPKMRALVSMKDGKEELSSDDARDEPFFNHMVVLPRLEKLVLCSLESMITIWDDNNLSPDSFCKLSSIEIEKCARIQSFIHTCLMERLQNLTKVRLLDLHKLRHVVTRSHILQEKALIFPSLRDIFVENCDSLIYLFPTAIARSLSELVNMHISSCKDLKEVVSFDGEEGNLALTEAMVFYNLCSLHLENLDSLVHFCSGRYELYFPFLKKLSIIGCMKLKTFVLRHSNLVGYEERFGEISSTSNIEVDLLPLFDEEVVFPNLEELRIKGLEVKEIWPKQEPASFLIDLKVLEVEGCHQLSTIIPSRILLSWHSLESLLVKSCNSVEVIFKLEKYRSLRKKIKHLRELTISSCESMQHIMAMGDDDYIEETHSKSVIFLHLSSLKLSELPRLGGFFNRNHQIELPSLMELEIKDCQAIDVLVADANQDCQPLLLVKKVEFPKMVSMEITIMQKLKDLWHIGIHSECSSEAFCKLKRLKFEKCDNLLIIFPSKMIRAFYSLEELSVKDCKSLESVFESPGLRSGIEPDDFNDVVLSTFALRQIHLVDLPRMKHVWNVEDPFWTYVSFERLYRVEIRDCRSLRHLFPTSVGRCLHQLHRLIIERCDEMEGIVRSEEDSADNCLEARASPKSTKFSLGVHSLEWPSLVHLRLQKCPNAKLCTKVQQKVDLPRLYRINTDARTLENWQFLDEIYAKPTMLALLNIENTEWVESIPWLLLLERFPSLHTLQIQESDSKEMIPSDYEKEGVKSRMLDIAESLVFYECRQLTILPSSLALFHNLTEVIVGKCNGLRHVVTSSAARGLVQLTKLVIHECDNLEEIVTNDCDENGNIAKDDADISFPRLKRLSLFELRSLRCFSSTNCNFNFPSLRSVNIRNLPKMQVFCEGGFDTPYKHRITRNVTALHNQEVQRWWIGPGN